MNGSVYYYYFLKITENASIFFAGIIFAKYNGICRVKRELYKIPCKTVVSAIGILAVMWSRCYIKGEALDIIYTVLFTSFFSVIFDRIKILKIILQNIGVHSTNMWLIHSFYCYYFLEATKIVYCTRNVWIDLLILFSMSLASSLLLDLFYAGVGKLINKIKNMTKKNDNSNKNEHTIEENKKEDALVCQ